MGSQVDWNQVLEWAQFRCRVLNPRYFLLRILWRVPILWFFPVTGELVRLKALFVVRLFDLRLLQVQLVLW